MSELKYDKQRDCIVSECRQILWEYPTITGLNVSYEFLLGKFRVCCVQGDKEILKDLAKKIYEGLLEEIKI